MRPEANQAQHVGAVLLVDQLLSGTMNETSIKDCRRALQWSWTRRQRGIPLAVQGKQVVIDRPIEVQGKHWVSGNLRLGAAEKAALTKVARKIIAEKVAPLPPWAFPPEISRRECLKAIEHAGGLSVTHLGKSLYITELSLRDNHWWSQERRLTPAMKKLLTRAAREVLHFDHFWTMRSPADTT